MESLEPSGDRERYCLRRFVVEMPCWDVATFRSLTKDDVEWWFRERRSVVVPPDVAVGHAFDHWTEGENEG